MALKKTAAKKISKKAARKVTKSKSKRAKNAPATAKAVKTARKTTTDGTEPRPKRKYKPSMSIDFQPGSDMYIAFQEVQKGGESRQAVGHRLQEMWTDHKTRNNKPKPVSTIMNHVVRRAKANGYRVEQTWRLVKDDGSPTVVQAAEGIAAAKPKKAAKSGKRRSKADALTDAKARSRVVAKKTSKKAVKRRTSA
jgi:hypothetical protein